MPDLTVTTFNVRGLRTPEKRSSVLRELWRARTQVAFIQETHFQVGKVPRFSDRRYAYAYHAPSPIPKSKGVSVLVARSVAWSLSETCIDPEVYARYVMVKGDMWGVQVTLVALYAPNSGQTEFVENLLLRVAEFTEGMWIVEGDFNMVLEPGLDSSSGLSHLTQSQRQHIKSVCFDFQLVDPWRIANPTVKDFSFYSAPHDSYSRIDWFLLQHSSLPSISSASMGSGSFGPLPSAHHDGD